MLVTIPAVAAAQSGLPSISAPLPTIGAPLPTISFPLPSISLPLPPSTTAPAPPPLHTRRPHHPRFVYIVPYFDYWEYRYPAPPPAPPAAPPEKEEPRTGTLRLDVQPETVQVFVDGYLVGTPADFRNQLELDLGTYTIELSAPGYQSEIFRVKVDGTRPIAYSGTLKPAKQ
jgi:hypothetical protein